MAIASVKHFWIQNNQHSNDRATNFLRATINTLEKCVSPKQGTSHSQDDKTIVALGLPAANNQVTILMDMKYEVRLTYQDFTVALMHKLILSVINVMDIKEKKHIQEKPLHSLALYI